MAVVDEFEVWSNRDTNTGYAVGSQVLESGMVYYVTLDGNWSAWGNTGSGDPITYDFGGPGGTIPPKYHIPGRIPQTHSQLSAEWWYGDTDVPYHYHGVVWALDGTTNFVHDAEPVKGIGDRFDSTNYVYTYRLVGQGHPLRVKVTDSNPVDNDGIIKVTVRRGGWYVGSIVSFGSDILIPWSARGWKYQIINYASGADPYAHSTEKAQPGYDDSGWATGPAPFGGTGSEELYPNTAATNWQVQSGIWLRKKFELGQPRDLQMHVKVDNLSYTYINGDLVDFYDNSYQSAGAGKVFTIPASAVHEGENTIAVLAWEESYNYGTAEGGWIDLELRKT
jgi:hypothetical protein